MFNKNTCLLIRRILIFAFLIFVLDLLVGSGLEYLYFKQIHGLYARTTYGLEKTNAQILIFGSSSANHHYNPTVFKEVLNLSTYNQGRDGIDILFNTAILSGILKRYSPEIVILNISINELSTNYNYDRLSALLPYVNKYPEMTEFISLRSEFERIKLFSKIYPYNSSFLTLVNGMFRVTNEQANDNGYVPIFGTLEAKNMKKGDYKNYSLDPNRKKALMEFIDLCKDRNIIVYLIFSPIFDFGSQSTQTMDFAKSLAQERGLTFLNFTNHPEFIGNMELFKDNGHLNHSGATKYSQIVAYQILTDLHRLKVN